MSIPEKQFQITETVGKGAFGTVYRAEMTGPGGFRKAVALKVLNDSLDDQGEFAERLRDEARILGLLNHRAIVRVDGLRRFDGRWAVVMEFVEGVDLKRVLTAGPVPVGPALEIVEEVASALDSAYHATDGAGRPVRLLHRDIKPSNIHLTARGEVKVLDFGVARADFQARESETKSIFFGSIGYMGPERMDGIDSHAGDVYALGVVLCELILGKTLGRSWSNPDRHEKHRTTALGALWKACPDRELYDLIGLCMAYKPEHRPTARDLARALRGIRARHREPWLRDWAEDLIPGLAQQKPAAEDKADGTMVADPGAVSAGRRGDTDVHGSSGVSASGPIVRTTDTAGTPAVAEEITRSSLYHRTSKPRRAGVSPWWVALGAAMAAMVVVMPVGLGVAWWAVQNQPRVVEPAPVVIEAVGSDDEAIEAFVGDEPDLDVDEPTEPEAPGGRPSTDAKPPAKPASQPKRTEPAQPAPRTPSSPPAPRDEPPPQAEAAPSGRVVVTGEARSVRLFGGGTSFGPGAVPAGTYSVKADFGDGALSAAGSVTVPANGVVTLSCRAGLKRCVTR